MEYIVNLLLTEDEMCELEANIAETRADLILTDTKARPVVGLVFDLTKQQGPINHLKLTATVDEECLEQARNNPSQWTSIETGMPESFYALSARGIIGIDFDSGKRREWRMPLPPQE